jgi:acetoacetyl-CoA reductase
MANRPVNGMGFGHLAGKVALVTGATRGIGRAIALELAFRGAAVAVNYRVNKQHAESLEHEIHKLGADCLLVLGDVAVKDEARAVVQTVLDSWGHLDILVNNAGIRRDKSLRKAVDDEWADVIHVNLNGTYYCTNAALPAMIERKFGRIINIASYVGEAGGVGPANYAPSKNGVIAFTKALAREMANYNITANVIAPGFTATEMLGQIPSNILDQIRAKIPLRRFAQPREVAKAAAFLAGDGDYITGHQLNINGGLYM